MTFYSIAFLIFFIVVIACMQAVRTVSQQHIVFLVANILFYGYWDARFLLLLGTVVFVCYVCACMYEKVKENAYVVIAVAYCLLILAVCKYLNFFAATFCAAFGINASSAINVILPLGISFYLLQAISYVMDVKHGLIESEHDFIKLAIYISFFPQITSGPIVKAHDFLYQLDRIHKASKDNICSGMQMFVLGLTKKIVFADRIGVAVDSVFSAPAAYNNVSILFAIIGYTIQIYCDFSGYSDMAIGVARIMDFDLGKNFDLPYIARNVSEFWRRWHISLSSWFRDYVYIQVGGCRAGRLRTYRNLIITMVLSGLWHGASWTYIIWGFAYGMAAVVDRIARELTPKKIKTLKVFDAACVVGNIILVSLLWVIFRADNVGSAIQIYKGLFRTGGILYINVYVVLYVILVIFGHIWCVVRNGGHASEVNLNLDGFMGKFAFCTWILMIVAFMYVGDSSFIYAQF